MKVSDVMVATPARCSPETNAGAAVEMLWNYNCGILPIVDAQQKVMGVITDRDLCIALGTRNKLPGEITVGEIVSPKLFYCKPEEDIRTALATMAEAQVRRLPVVDDQGRLQGVLSMDDVVLHATAKGIGKGPALSADDVVATLKKLYRPQLPEVQKAAAA